MSFWRELVGDVKKIVVLHDDVRRLEANVGRLGDRVAGHGERIARIEGMLGWLRADPPPTPRLPEA